MPHQSISSFTCNAVSPITELKMICHGATWNVLYMPKIDATCI